MQLWPSLVASDLFLIISHQEEGGNDCNPIKVVREDRAIGGRIFPPKQGVEDSPSSATIQFGIAALLLFLARLIH